MDALALRVAARYMSASDPLAEDVEAKGTPRGWEKRREKDDFTEQNIPSEYLLLFRRLKKLFKGTPHERAEQFMEYVEEHPGENMEYLQEHADKEVAKLTREWEKAHREQVKQEKECDKNQTKYEDAWYKEQERATKEKNNLKQLKEQAEGACQACPTCDESEGPRDYGGGGGDISDVPFAASERVAARYKNKKKVKNKDGEETTVYEYSDKQIEHRNREKAKRIEKLRHKIDDVRSKVKKDLKSTDPEKMLTALAVGLMDHTFERVGNEESADDGHFGVTGWQRKHISFGKDVTIKYVGKSGVKHEKKVTDAALKKALRDAYEASDDEDASIFEYDGGKVTAEKVNAYLKEFDVTAKDIRGMHANVEMQERLKEVRKKGGKLPEDKKKREKQLKDEFKEALEGAADAVGHEPSTLKSQYLVPGLEETYLKDGTIIDKLSHRVLGRFLAATQIAYGPAGAGLTFQADFPLSTPCEKCGTDAPLHVTLAEDGPTLETYRPEYDAAIAQGWGDAVTHDCAAFATYLCPNCYAATTLWNQA